MTTDTFFHWTPNSHPVNELFVWLSVDGNGNEGIMAVRIAGQNFPLVRDNEAGAMRLVPMVQDAVNSFPTAARLVKFTNREELMRLNPRR